MISFEIKEIQCRKIALDVESIVLINSIKSDDVLSISANGLLKKTISLRWQID
jgi:hypothetical protein